MSSLTFAMNKHGSGFIRKAVNASLAAALVLGLLPAGIMAAPRPAYASEEDTTRYAPIEQIIESGLDEDLVEIQEDDDIDPLGWIKALLSIDEGNLRDTGHVIAVSTLMTDADAMAPDDDAESIWASAEHAMDAVLGQYDTAVSVYDPGEESDWWVAFVNESGTVSSGDVVDATFAANDTTGSVFDDCVYDPDSGIAYIPKARYFNEGGEEIPLSIKVQLVCKIDLTDDAPQAAIDVRIDNGNRDVTAVSRAQSVESPALDMTTTVPVTTAETAAAITLDDIEVRVDGAENALDLEDNAVWDQATGELTLAFAPTELMSIDIKITGGSFFGTARAYAEIVNYDDPADLRVLRDAATGELGTLENIGAGDLTVGSKMTYNARTNYDSSNSRYEAIGRYCSRYLYGWFNNTVGSPNKVGYTDALIERMWSDASCTWSKVSYTNLASEYVPSALNDLNFIIDGPNIPYKEEKDADGNWVRAKTTQADMPGGLDWSGWPTTYTSEATGDMHRIALVCGHPSSASGVPDSVDVKAQGDSDWRQGTTAVRPVYVDPAGEYAVFGFVTPKMYTQAGVGMYKVKLGGGIEISLKKTSTMPDLAKVADVYTFKNIKYGIYSDAKCTDLEKTVTFNADGTCKAMQVSKGTHYVKEISTNGLYKKSDTVTKIDVDESHTDFTVADEPVMDPSGLILQKIDADTGEPTAQGAASLALAEYTFEYISYYDEGKPITDDAAFDAAAASAKAKRTWTLRTDGDGWTNLGYGNKTFQYEGKGYSYKVSGDDFFKTAAGTIALPVGTLRVKESAAPEGYKLNTDSYIISIIPDTTSATGVKLTGDVNVVAGQVPEVAPAEESVVKGGVTIFKLDKEIRQKYPHAGTPWTGVRFDIKSYNEKPITVNDIEYNYGDIVMSIYPGAEDGEATTGPGVLPYGEYGISEVAPPNYGYYLSDQSERRFTIEEERMYVFDGDPQKPGSGTDGDAVFNQVHRGDIEFVKKDEVTQDRLAYVPFAITNVASGETHVVVTDENGQFKSVNSWNAHTKNTNGFDKYYDTDGDGKLSEMELSASLDPKVIDPNSCYNGTWFGTDTAGNKAPVNNSLCAFHYGEYKIQELACPRNSERTLISANFSIRRDGVMIDLGTLDDQPLPEKPSISTVARDADDGDHAIVREPFARIIDRVDYVRLEKAKTYRMVGTLMDTATGEPLRNGEGNIIQVARVFQPEAEDGYIELTFDLDARKVQGDVVVFEKCYELREGGDGNGDEVAAHEDITDYYQTIKVVKPSIGTKLTDAMDGDKIVWPDHTIVLTDTVTYKNVPIGKTLTVTGTLMTVPSFGGGEAQVLMNEDGTPVTATTTFTPDRTDGTTEVTFRFSGDILPENRDLVAYEKLFIAGTEIADHEDPNDPMQTVTVTWPFIGTMATDALDGDKLIASDIEGATVNDLVSYTNLLPDYEYILECTVMVVDEGFVGVEDDGTGKPQYDAAGNRQWPHGARPLLDANGQPVTKRVKFTAHDTYGEVTVPVKFDTSAIAGKSIVMYEALYKGNRFITRHEDPNDDGQTVEVTTPKIGTMASDATDGDHLLEADEDIIINDLVSYQNLTPGREYTLDLTVMIKPEAPASAPSKITGGNTIVTPSNPSVPSVVVDDDGNETGVVGGNTLPIISSGIKKDVLESPLKYNADGSRVYPNGAEPLLDKNGQPYTARLKFTPTEQNGQVKVSVQIDCTDLAGRDLVMYEVLTRAGVYVAHHEDPNDEDQSVHVTEASIGTTATDKTDGDHEILASKTAAVVDTISYTGLVPGKEYLVKGTLMDKETGKPLKDDHGAVTVETRFTPNTSHGTVDVEFAFDASKLAGHSLVAYEELYKNGKLVAEHKDLTDEDQTVTVRSLILPDTGGADTPGYYTPGGSYAQTGVDTSFAMAVAFGLIVIGMGGMYMLFSSKFRKNNDAKESKKTEEAESKEE